jgi:hypothetical protein
MAAAAIFAADLITAMLGAYALSSLVELVSRFRRGGGSDGSGGGGGHWQPKPTPPRPGPHGWRLERRPAPRGPRDEARSAHRRRRLSR